MILTFKNFPQVRIEINGKWEENPQVRNLQIALVQL